MKFSYIPSRGNLTRMPDETRLDRQMHSVTDLIDARDQRYRSCSVLN